ncbi:MAG: ABC transporter permease [Firmicutes bacterium]|nr:ABC transporter permease [Bacillota bacterium]MDH7496263.1 ABC transporter permease [Bacillota bacterium]
MRVTWVVMIALVAFEALMIGGMALWAQSRPGAGDMTGEERELAARATSFPASVPFTISFAASFGPLFAVIIAARLAGDEYALGTVKQQVSMGVDRRRCAAVKLAAAALSSLLLLVTAVVAGTAISLVVTMALGRPVEARALTVPFMVQVARGFGIAWFTLTLYSVLTVCTATLTRSAAAATTVGIVVLLLEASLMGSLAARFAAIARIVPYTIGHNVNVLLALIEQGEAAAAQAAQAAAGAVQAGHAASAAAQAHAEAQAGVAEVGAVASALYRAFAVLGAWLAAFAGCSVWALGRQELGEE